MPHYTGLPAVLAKYQALGISTWEYLTKAVVFVFKEFVFWSVLTVSYVLITIIKILGWHRLFAFNNGRSYMHMNVHIYVCLYIHVCAQTLIKYIHYNRFMIHFFLNEKIIHEGFSIPINSSRKGELRFFIAIMYPMTMAAPVLQWRNVSIADYRVLP